MVPVSVPVDIASSLLAMLLPSPGQAGATLFSAKNDTTAATFEDSLLSALEGPSPSPMRPSAAKSGSTAPRKDEKESQASPALAAAVLPVASPPLLVVELPNTENVPNQIAVSPSISSTGDDATAADHAAQSTLTSPGSGISVSSPKVDQDQNAFSKPDFSQAFADAQPVNTSLARESVYARSFEPVNDKSDNNNDSPIAITHSAGAVSPAQPTHDTVPPQSSTPIVPSTAYDLPFVNGIDLPSAQPEGVPSVIPTKGTPGQTNVSLAKTGGKTSNSQANAVADRNPAHDTATVDGQNLKPATAPSLAVPARSNLEAQLAETLKAHAPLLSVTESEKVISTPRESKMTDDRDKISSSPPVATKPDLLPKEGQAVQPISNAKPSETKPVAAKPADPKPVPNPGFPPASISDSDAGSLPPSIAGPPANSSAALASTQTQTGVEDAHSVPESKATPAPSPDLPAAPAPSTGTVQTAHLVDQLGQTEMRIGLRTSAFGNVEVHTIVRDAQVGVAMGSERGDLKSFLASEVPALQSVFRQQNLQLESIHFTGQGGTLNAGFSGGAEQQSRSFRPQVMPRGPVTNDGTTAEAAEVESPMQRWPGLNVHA